MDVLDPLRSLARYNRWMNEKLYRLAAALPEEERRRDLGAFFSSIHGTLNHILLADHVWMTRMALDPAPFVLMDGSLQPIVLTALDQELYADFDELRSVRERMDGAIEAWVGELGATDLDRVVSYRNTSGAPFEHPLWWALTHMLNHGTHHRGQVTTLLKQLGHDPGVTDLMMMFRERGMGADRGGSVPVPGLGS